MFIQGGTRWKRRGTEKTVRTILNRYTDLLERKKVQKLFSKMNISMTTDYESPLLQSV